MHQIAMLSGAPAAESTRRRADRVRAFDLQQHRVRAGAGREEQVVMAPGRIGAVQADHDLAGSVAALGQRLADPHPGIPFRLRSDRVFKIHDQDVGGEAACLLECAGWSLA